ncbi:MAG: ABC transporter [Chloroflexi bacterium]|nr:MAG: ABC transporter [Chloroflexota bacterium]
MQSDQAVRKQLLFLLDGGGAHMSFDEAVADFPLAHINSRPAHVPYTFWHLLEHLRIAQWDILEFIRNQAHVSPPWPEGYWPPPAAQADAAQWQQTLAAFRADLQTLRQLAEDPSTDLYSDLPHAAGYNILREILLVADHNAYHIGELAILRQVMGLWPLERVS